MKLFESYSPQQRSLLRFLLIIPLAGIAGAIILLSNTNGVGIGAASYRYSSTPTPDKPKFELVGRGFDFVDDYGPAPRSTTSSNTGTNYGGGYVVPNTGTTTTTGSVTTFSAQNVTDDSATLRGRVNGRFASDTWFVVSRTTSNPSCSTSSLQTSSAGSISAGDDFDKHVTLNHDDEDYYYRACAFINGQTVAGSVRDFHTDDSSPSGGGGTGNGGGGGGTPTPLVNIHFDFVSASCGAMGVIQSLYSITAEPEHLSGNVSIGITANTGTILNPTTVFLNDGTTTTLGSITVNNTFPWGSLVVHAIDHGDPVLAEVTQETPTAAQLPGCGSLGTLRIEYDSSYCSGLNRMDTYRVQARTSLPLSGAIVSLEKNGTSLYISNPVTLGPSGWTHLGSMTVNSNNVSPSFTGVSADMQATGGIASGLDIVQTLMPVITTVCTNQGLPGTLPGTN